MPKVSVVIPVYNAEQYLRKCLESVVGQTYQDIEVIIVNDGSKDTSEEICRGFLEDSRVKYFYQENAGPAVAMNYGLSVAAGEYIWFVDADDWIEADAVARLKNETADMVIFNFFRGENEKHLEPVEIGVYDKTAIEKYIYPKLLSYVDQDGKVNYIFHNTWMRLYKREFLQQNRICFHPKVRNGLDLLFSFEAVIKASTISFRTNDYLYHYRPASNSMTSAYIKNYWEGRHIIIDILDRMIPDDSLRSQMPLRIFYWSVIGIENELRYPQGTKERIKQIVEDPICDVFKGKLDVSKFNEKNQRFYWYFCDSDADGIWLEYQRRMRARKRKKMIRHIKQKIKSILYVGN